MSQEQGMEYNDVRAALIKKYEAEARKADAEALSAQIEGTANAARLEAEAGRLLAEENQLITEGHKLKVELDTARIDHRNKVREQAEKESKNEYHHIHHYTDTVSESSVNALIRQCDIWRRAPIDGRPFEKVEVIFTSPGGDVIEGMRLFDYFQQMRRDGIEVVTGAYGYAASMAGILLQAGSHRWIGAEGWVLIHQISAGSFGKVPEMADRQKFLERIQERVIDIFAKRAWALREEGKEVGPVHIEKATKDDHDYDGREEGLWEKLDEVKTFIRFHWARKDLWLSSKDCFRLGFVDEVR